MMNYLRIALKHIQNSMEHEITRGNYCVCKVIIKDTEAIRITHLKFMGKSEFHICYWLPKNKSIFICPGADLLNSEIILAIRSLNRLGIQVEYIVSSDDTDVTEQYSCYFRD